MLPDISVPAGGSSQILAGFLRSKRRLTRSRIAILAAANEGPPHFTVEELHRRVLHKGCRVSLATIYNTLNMLNSVGLVRKFAVGGRRTIYDLQLSPHAHIIDLENGSISDFHSVEMNLSDLSIPSGYEIHGIHVVVHLRSSEVSKLRAVGQRKD